jgi:hypothetical protein
MWIIYFESANYCGYGEYCIVNAETEDEARNIAEPYAESHYYDEDSDQYYQDYEGEEAECWASIMRVEEFGPEHDCWEYYQDPNQTHFYPVIN